MSIQQWPTSAMSFNVLSFTDLFFFTVCKDIITCFTLKTLVKTNKIM